MNSLKQISQLGSELSTEELSSIIGGKSNNYSNTWWYKSLDTLGKFAEGSAGLWHLKY
ncbi:bacteriocin [Pseudolactococcus carnosus]|uniref:bacteriocin n=1 Tax=Pseudolactococcus carnosus TaxID=2749961 RepID=UPI0009A56F67|nr:bacteriocin [Lactococcus carnosus]MCJ1968872.1 bacteriocin [Lactococcus carnosus]MCJ1974064.1 bacteriocin [Lactococcus carnosus]MCJ1981104.1 bacteriocin [Lactococcus carnosus]MCJ1987782.1 bacteriocin [Lactococcus carnosus]MCJ2003349.1 bacteriocin [Lactococcus carnosus]